jgi:hypothetical protein
LWKTQQFLTSLPRFFFASLCTLLLSVSTAMLWIPATLCNMHLTCEKSEDFHWTKDSSQEVKKKQLLVDVKIIIPRNALAITDLKKEWKTMSSFFKKNIFLKILNALIFTDIIVKKAANFYMIYNSESQLYLISYLEALKALESKSPRKKWFSPCFSQLKIRRKLQVSVIPRYISSLSNTLSSFYNLYFLFFILLKFCLS